MNTMHQQSGQGSGAPLARSPIAIVGIGCRLPGANGPEAFWRLLEQGVDAVSEVPAERWSKENFFQPQQVRPGKSLSHWGGFVDRIDQFDPQFFGISPREAARMDPQQRMLLEVAWGALEDAGQPAEQLAGTHTAVFVGISSWDYALQGLSFEDRGVISPYSNTGGSGSIAANRISYCFDLRGPSLAVDTACSSSLVALHLACHSIWRDGVPMALAGGVNALLMPDFYVAFSQLGVLSPDGRCKTFDARANGYVRSEGAGMVLLKPLAQALADGDRIYSVIRGTAVNQDGRTPGMTVPCQQAQEILMRQACCDAGVQPGDIDYVEAHGTGTPVGDPIEARAIGNVVGTARPADRPCLVGSVKTNIGHLEAGAGIASTIKVALSLYHGRIPAHLHLERPNPEIPLDALRLRVPTSTQSWPERSAPRTAGINGFGYGGTNAHIIMQQAPLRVEAAAARDDHAMRDSAPVRHEIVTVSARTPAALRTAAADLAHFVSQAPANITLADIAQQTLHRRTHHDYRLALVTNDRQQLAEQLAAYSQSHPAAGIIAEGRRSSQPARIAFVCAGQGPQWWGMGRQLLANEPVFRNVVEQCNELARQLANWPLMREFEVEESQSRMTSTAIAQPCLFVLQVALARLWQSWGVQPDVVIGHSVGEIAAAHLAGALSLEEAFRVVYHRGRCMDRASSHGRMLAAALPEDEARRLIARWDSAVVIAAVNSPSLVSLSGQPQALREIQQQLTEQGVFCRPLAVEYAFHSPQMDPLRDDLLRALQDLHPRAGTLPLVSTVTGDFLDGRQLDGHYWWRNVREPVLFAAGARRLAAAEYPVLIELGPHPVLSYAITETYQAAGHTAHVFPSLRRDESDSLTMLRSLANLYTLGQPVAWQQIAPRPHRHINLPAYPWQLQRCWYESPEVRQTRHPRREHPLLGVSKTAPQPCWQSRMQLALQPYLAEHRVQDIAVVPAAAYVEMALAAARLVHDQPYCQVDELKLLNPGVLNDESSLWFETQYHRDSRTLHIAARGSEDDSWTAISQCVLGPGEPPRVDGAETFAAMQDELQQRCNVQFSQQACYDFFAKLKLDYGPAFCGITTGWRRDGEALTRIELPAEVGPLDDYVLHPALIDACFQSVLPTDKTFLAQPDGLYLPAEIQQVRLYRSLRGRAWCHARLQSKTARYLDADLDIYNDVGELAVTIRGFRSQRVTGQTAQPKLEDLLYGYTWQLQDLPPVPTAAEVGHWLLMADRQGVAAQLAEQVRSAGGTVTLVEAGSEFQQHNPNHFVIDPDAPQQLRRVLEAVVVNRTPALRGIVHLWNLDAPHGDTVTTEQLSAAQVPGVLSLLHLVQQWEALPSAEIARLVIVTRGAQSVRNRPEPVAVAQTPVIGFGRVIGSEYAGLHCRLVDLDPAHHANHASALLGELMWSDDEDEVALRGGARYVHRFQPLQSQPLPADVVRQASFRLAATRSGSIESLALRRCPRPAPADHEIEVEVQAAGLNFSDVMKALNLYPGLPEGPPVLGAECAGIVTRVGADVHDLHPGQRVVAVAGGSLASHVVVPADLAAVIPSQLDWDQAATIPIALLTAWYALHELARLDQGEKVLIHSASGGVGLAAIQLARRAGAEIFATAGTEEKRQYLRRMGIAHVMDSRSLEFADTIAELTEGRGVDVVLNSLPGEAIARGLDCLAVGGRFLEIGKRDIYQNARLGLRPFRSNLSFFAIDLDLLLRRQPARLGKWLRQLLGEIERGELAPLPMRVFAADEIVAALRWMQQGKHIGKVVVSMRDKPQTIAAGDSDERAPLEMCANGTYLITGGLGGFGLELARRLVARGARSLVLMGRSGKPTSAAQTVLEEMRATGANVRIVAADVTQSNDVRAVLDDIRRSLPPLRGVFHAAMVLEDGLLVDLDRKWMQRVMDPKIKGGWNLHRLTADDELDYFVLFSSLSSVFGHAGQGNYAAANAMLDGLTYYRRAMGKPCLTINWGYLGDVGYLAQRQQLGQRLERQGVLSFTVNEALDALEYALQQQAAQLSVLRMDWSRWRGLGVTGRVSPRLAHLVIDPALNEGVSSSGPSRRDAVRLAQGPQRCELIERLLRGKLSRLLGIDAAGIDSQITLLDLGLDSLMAVELRNWLESQLEISLPVVQVMRTPSLNNLVTAIADQLEKGPAMGEGQTAETAVHAADDEDATAQLLASVPDLSAERVDQLLSDLLGERRMTESG